MAIGAEYNRFQWERSGGWDGVEDYVSFLELWFFDEYDEAEDEEVDPTSTDLGDGRLLLKWRYQMPYRAYDRTENGWQLVVEEVREKIEKQIVRLPAAERPPIRF